MKRNIKFGLTYLLTFIGLLFLFSLQANAEENQIKPKEVLIKEELKNKLPEEKRKVRCIPEHDIFHQPSCIVV